MKSTSSSKLCWLALAATVLTAGSASAALSYNFGDLFVGFRQTSGGSANDYAINLGSAEFFKNLTTPYTLNLGASVISDLNAALGTGWASSPLTQWGFASTTGNLTNGSDAAQTLYTSKVTGAANPKSTNSQSGPSNSMLAFENNYFLTLTESSGVPNAAQGVAGNANSWSTRAGLNFGASANLNPVLNPISSDLDLFRIPQGTNQANVTNEGTFTFDKAAGTLTFTPVVAPIPEPSAALFGAATLCGLVLRRRRAVIA